MSTDRYLIVVGIDYSDTSKLALDRAFDLAHLRPRAELHIINVARANDDLVLTETGDGLKVRTLEEASRALQDLAEAKAAEFREAHPEGSGVERIVTHLGLDHPAEQIAELAADLEADLIVVGTHGRRGVRRLLLGSVAEEVMRLADCPVMVVRPRAEARIPKIQPVCPKCLERRAATQGSELWCAQHQERHGRRHSYHYVDRNAQSRENLPLVEPQD